VRYKNPYLGLVASLGPILSGTNFFLDGGCELVSSLLLLVSALLSLAALLDFVLGRLGHFHLALIASPGRMLPHCNIAARDSI